MHYTLVKLKSGITNYFPNAREVEYQNPQGRDTKNNLNRKNIRSTNTIFGLKRNIVHE